MDGFFICIKYQPVILEFNQLLIDLILDEYNDIALLSYCN